MMRAWMVLALSACLFGEVTQKEIDLAIEKGADYLKKNYVAGRVQGMGDAEELVALTLAHAGVSPEAEPLKTLLARILKKPLSATYNTTIQAVLLALVDPRKHRARIAECGQWLVDAQCQNGQWTYGGNPAQTPDKGAVSGAGAEPTWTLKPQRGVAPAGGDNSNAQFGLLGLWAATIAGVKVPTSAWDRAEGWWKKGQSTDGGWGYGGKDLSYGSMTCAGIAAMSICGRGRGEPSRNDGPAGGGLRWLGNNFSVKENPRCGQWTYYYLYSLERAGSITGQKQIAGRDWYQAGARFLVDNQHADGSWQEQDPITDTCFAILFLKRATLSMVTPMPIDRASVTPDDPSAEPAEPEKKGEEGK